MSCMIRFEALWRCSLHGVSLLQRLCYRRELDVAGSFIDGTDLAVSEHLLSNSITNEAHSTHPFYGLATDLAGHLASI
jgi:hypothetical protein